VSAAGQVSDWAAVALSLAGAVIGLGVYFGVLILLRSEDVAGLTQRIGRRRSPAAR